MVHWLTALPPWTLVFDRNATVRAGLCSHRTRTIHLASEYARKVADTELRDTALHEIAHALTRGHAHDAVWRAEARRIGCSSLRCHGVLFDARSVRTQRAIEKFGL